MKASPRIHVPSLLQFALNGLALTTTLPLVLFVLTLAAAQLFADQTIPLNIGVLLSFAWTGAFISLLLAPGIVLALFRLFGHQPPRLLQGSPLRLATIALAFWPVILLAGWVSSTRDVLPWLALPPLQVLAVALPLWWFIEIGRYKLLQGSAQRGWGVFSLGMLLGPALSMVVELILIVILIVGVGIWVSAQPDLMRELQRIFTQLEGLDPQSPRALELLRPYLTNPGVIGTALLVISGFIPMIEELIKPLPVLILALWRKLPPAEGFAAGLLAGGAFGLIESLGTAINLQGEDWAPVLAMRAGTGLLHVVSTGLVSWGIASAIHDKRWLRLLLSYLAAVSLHGLWNMGAVIAGGSDLNLGQEYTGLIIAASILLGLVALALYAILVSMNRRLRPAAPTAAAAPDLNQIQEGK